MLSDAHCQSSAPVTLAFVESYVSRFDDNKCVNRKFVSRLRERFGFTTPKRTKLLAINGSKYEVWMMFAVAPFRRIATQIQGMAGIYFQRRNTGILANRDRENSNAGGTLVSFAAVSQPLQAGIR